jgi:hypothetical protein
VPNAAKPQPKKRFNRKERKGCKEEGTNLGVGMEGCNSFFMFCAERKIMKHFVVSLDISY